MTDYEPYVADPREPAAPQRLARAAPLLVLVIVVLLGGHLARAVLVAQAEQDPSLDVPAQPDQSG